MLVFLKLLLTFHFNLNQAYVVIFMLKNDCLTFDDVLIEPSFSTINSRKDVDLSTHIGNLNLNIPLLSANMDTVFSFDLAKALSKEGGCSVVHRFFSIEDNVSMCQKLIENNVQFIASIGLGTYERERAENLIQIGVKNLCIDVAHGAQQAVVDQYNSIIEKHKSNVEIIVGNFASGRSIQHFRELCMQEPVAIKVGIGGGSACLTRVQTGCGVPQLHALIDSIKHNPESNIISDGAHKTPGDVAKALAAGANSVMLGYIFATTTEAAGEIIDGKFKKYRGSASLESYKVQNKEAEWRTYEGDSFVVPIQGSVNEVVQNITGGLRSSFTYVGAHNLKEFHEKAHFLKVSHSTQKENNSHGKS